MGFVLFCNHTFGYLPMPRLLSGFQAQRHRSKHSAYCLLFQHCLLRHPIVGFVLFCNHTFGYLPMPGLPSGFQAQRHRSKHSAYCLSFQHSRFTITSEHMCPCLACSSFEAPRHCREHGFLLRHFAALTAQASHSRLCVVSQSHLSISAHAWLAPALKHPGTAENTPFLPNSLLH